MRRAGRQPRGGDEVGGVHPELAGAVVADEADSLEAGVLAHGGAEHHRHLAAGVRRDRLEACQLAGRLDGHGADPGLDGGPQLVVALARSGHDDPGRLDPGPEGRGQLPGRRDVGAEPACPRCATTASAGFAFTAYATSATGGRTERSAATWRSTTSRS